MVICVSLKEKITKFLSFFTPPYAEFFGSIATNEKNKLFVVNVSHRFCDGGFIKFLLDKLNNHEYPTEISILPRFSTDIFKDEIANSRTISAPINDKSIFRFRPNQLASPINTYKIQAHTDIKMKANQTYFLYETLKNNFLYQIKRCDYKQFDFIRWISKQLKHKKSVPDLKKFVQ